MRAIRFQNHRFRIWLLPVGAIAVYFCGLFSVAELTDKRVDVVWRHLGVSALPVSFYDVRIIAAQIESIESGDQIYEFNRPDMTSYNYLRVWMGLRYLGLDLSTAKIWGWTLVSLFWLLAIPLSLRPNATFREGLFLSALLCSPVSMLAIERGNSDLVIFTIIAIALLANTRPWLASALLAVASIAKIYPVFAAAALGSRAGFFRRWAPTIVVGVVLLGYTAFHLSDLGVIIESTPRRAVLSYGSSVPFLIVKARLELPVTQSAAQIFGWISVAVLIIAVGRYQRTAPAPLSSPHDSSFMAGAGIYCGTFLIGANYDYRCIFLMFCLPALWLGQRDPINQRDHLPAQRFGRYNFSFGGNFSLTNHQ